MIDKFEMFIALAREKHFGRAAEACHVTQPSLSSAIRSLEEHYGRPLVQRGARYMGLTPEGERLLPRARSIVAEARAIRDDLMVPNASLSGKLRLGVIPTALSEARPLAASFLARNPEVQLSLHSMSSQEILEALADFQIDAGLSYSRSDHRSLTAAGLTTLPLYHEAWAAILPARDAPEMFDWHDLARFKLGLLAPNMQNRRLLEALFEHLKLEVRPQLETDSMLALASHARSEGSAALLPLGPAKLFAGLPELALRPLPQPEGLTQAEVALLVPQEGRRGHLLDAFLRQLRR